MKILVDFGKSNWTDDFVITNSGTPFFVTDSFMYNDKPTFRSGVIGNSGTSKTNLTFEINYDGSISFAYRVSSENNYDWFTIFLDGAQIARISGEKNWVNFQRNLTKGTHTLTLQYTKDGSASSNHDMGIIANLEIDGVLKPEFDWVTTISDP